MTASADRRALLTKLLEQRAADPTHELTHAQQRLWFLDQLAPGTAVYTIPLGFDVHGPLDQAALRLALTEVVRRHEVLRSVFPAGDGSPRQVVRPPGPVDVDLVEVPGPDRLEDLARQEAQRPFDLASEPPLRALLLRSAPDEHRLLLTIHHIACDGWSVGVLCRELSELYRAFRAGQPASLPKLPVQYGDFAQWQLSQVRGGAFDADRAYWTRHLAGLPELAGLPVDHSRPAVPTYRGAEVTATLPAGTAARLRGVARTGRATPFAVALAAFAVLLGRYCGATEVVVGTPVAGRSRPEVADLIGFFTNTLVLRIDLAGDPAFDELVDRVRAEILAALAHQEVPFEQVVEDLQPQRDVSRNPLFQVLFNAYEDDAATLDLAECEVEPRPGNTGTAKFDLSMSLSWSRDDLRTRLEYSSDLFHPDTAHRLAEQYRTLLLAAVAEPGRRIGDLPVLSESERHRLAVEWNGPPTDYPEHATLADLFARQVAATPAAPALTDDGTELTYAELDEQADQLARRLAGLGVGPETVVGVYLDRSVEMVVAVLGILKAGGAYLPLDPAYPAARLAYTIADSGAPLVVTRTRQAGRAAALGVPVVAVDAIGEATTATAASAVPAAPAPARPDDLAYVIYTSGSTGQPKGVMISHRAVANLVAGLDAVVGNTGSTGTDTWLAVTSLSFDISVVELLWTLFRGHRVIVHPQPVVSAGSAPTPTRQVDFSLFYFGSDVDGGDPASRYRLLLEGARFADRHGFAAVWTPERHFHRFGGLYPNPSVMGAALATITERVRIRAGSVVLPLHDPLRVAEEWSVVDNLSGGRVDVSFASGWHANDFVLAPDRYDDRKHVMLDGIDEVRRLWRGGRLARRGGGGRGGGGGHFPPPGPAGRPGRLANAPHPDTLPSGGELGAGVLTHMLGHSLDQLAEKIELYRRAWRAAGHGPGDGRVTVMLHTFIGTDLDAVRETVRGPLSDYLRTSFDLLANLGPALGSGADLASLPPHELDALVDRAFDRFFSTAGLLGTPDTAAEMVERLAAIGVDEVACLVDFGVPEDAALGALPHLREVMEETAARRQAAAVYTPVADQLARHPISHLQCTPTLAQLELAGAPAGEAAGEALRRLRLLLVGGEPLPASLGAQLAALVPAVHNMYGPTEATVWAATHPVPREPAVATVPIGRPMANVRAYVVDRELRLVPTGAPGELLLGGPGVARGYRGRPGLTAERFVPDPFSGELGARLYRTGDQVRWRGSGELEFLGRLDEQVKLHGHRIELGEIESTLLRQPGVAGAAVVLRGQDTQPRIVAYCVQAAGHGADLTPAALRAHLAASLPEYMVPAAYVLLDRLPLLPNGKVDRRALPEPDAATPRARSRPPASELERSIARIWHEVLQVDQIGADDNFFEVGGNSLLVVQVRARLIAELGRGPSLVDMFRYPSVAALATALDGAPAEHSRLADRRREAAQRREAIQQRGALASQAPRTGRSPQ